MTSKEALTQLSNMASPYYWRSKNQLELIEIVEQDLDRLEKLEDLEEELGIDLLMLFKAFKDGIYSRDYGYLLVEHFVLKHEKQLHCKPLRIVEYRFALKDYGKTWALTREELLGNDK